MRPPRDGIGPLLIGTRGMDTLSGVDLLIVAANGPASLWNAVTITTAVVASLAAFAGLGGLILGIVNSLTSGLATFPASIGQEWDSGAPGEEISTRGKRFYLENVGHGAAHQVKNERWMPAYQGRHGRWNVLHSVDEVPFGKSIAQ